MMTDIEIRDYYASLLADHGATHRAGDHGSVASMARRHHVLREGVRWASPYFGTVLDVGCGIGTMARGLHGRYTGWDIVPTLIEVARATYPTSRFEVRDLLDSRACDAFDFVWASGLFQFRDPHYLREAVARMFALSRHGVAFNWLTRADGTPGETAHDPLVVLAFGRTLTTRVVLRTDYQDNDASLYLFK